MKDDGNYPGIATPNRRNRIILSRQTSVLRQPAVQVVRRRSTVKSQPANAQASLGPVSSVNQQAGHLLHRPGQAPAPPPTTTVISLDDGREAIAARRRQRNRERRMLLKAIMQRWPQAFPAHPAQVRPLMVGIHRAMANELPDYSLKQISHAITLWRRSRAVQYLRAIARGGHCYDLNGNPQTVITAEERQQARATLATLEELWRAQQKRQPFIHKARKASRLGPTAARSTTR